MLFIQSVSRDAMMILEQSPPGQTPPPPRSTPPLNKTPCGQSFPVNKPPYINHHGQNPPYKNFSITPPPPSQTPTCKTQHTKPARQTLPPPPPDNILQPKPTVNPPPINPPGKKFYLYKLPLLVILNVYI